MSPSSASSRRTPGSTLAAARIDRQWIPAFAGMTAEKLSASEPCKDLCAQRPPDPYGLTLMTLSKGVHKVQV